MEDDAICGRRRFLCFNALTAAIVEFGGLSSYTADRVDIVLHNYRQHIKDITNNSLVQETSEVFAGAD